MLKELEHLPLHYVSKTQPVTDEAYLSCVLPGPLILALLLSGMA